jgi:hypothetical protein
MKLDSNTWTRDRASHISRDDQSNIQRKQSTVSDTALRLCKEFSIHQASNVNTLTRCRKYVHISLATVKKNTTHFCVHYFIQSRNNEDYIN